MSKHGNIKGILPPSINSHILSRPVDIKDSSSFTFSSVYLPREKLYQPISGSIPRQYTNFFKKSIPQSRKGNSVFDRT
jgi:hypothetical protein